MEAVGRIGRGTDVENATKERSQALARLTTNKPDSQCLDVGRNQRWHCKNRGYKRFLELIAFRLGEGYKGYGVPTGIVERVDKKHLDDLVQWCFVKGCDWRCGLCCGKC